ncbi:MAG: hypothetical protein EOM87_02595 [Clostridia bacterium]|nr:hypothetical protein [Clostridia bacterium]
MKKFLIVISVILLFALTATMAVGCKQPTPVEPLDIEAGSRPDFANGITASELVVINAGLASNATDAQRKAAVLCLFYAADRIQLAADTLFKISDGSGYAKSGAEGNMTVRGFYFRSGSSFYSQTAGQITSANVGSLIPNATNVARNMLDQLGRTYTPDMETFYRQKAEDGKGANKPNVAAYDHFPYVSADYSKCKAEEFTLEQWRTKDRILNTVGELSNFAFNVNAIKDAEISLNEEEHFYRIEFALDTGNKGTDYDDVVNFAREGLREASTSDNLDYVIYNVTLEIWDNGYIRTFSSVENWEATLKIYGLKLDGVSDSSNTTSYYWDWEEIKDVIDDYEAYDEAETPADFLNILNWR